MDNGTRAGSSNSLAALQRLAKSRRTREACDLCSIELAMSHRHLLEMANRQVVCACDPCALRFQDVVGARYKLIPRDTRVLANFHLEDAEWESLALPINLVFFFNNSTVNKITALYPSPAGATESLVPLEAWETFVKDNPVLGHMEADVEALLVNRVVGKRSYYLAPIDVCYELVGLIRMHWRGLSGGTVVWQRIDEFFSTLNDSARPAVAAEPEVSRV